MNEDAKMGLRILDIDDEEAGATASCPPAKS